MLGDFVHAAPRSLGNNHGHERSTVYFTPDVKEATKPCGEEKRCYRFAVREAWHYSSAVVIIPSV